MIKKILKSIGIIFGAFLLIVIGYITYVLLDYKRVEDNQELPIFHQTANVIELEKEYKIITYNIGFGAYEDDYSFFMDGGKYSRAFSKDRLEKNLENIKNFLKEQNSDFYLLQEVDELGTRSYKVNQKELFINAFNDYEAVWAQNYDSSYLFYPFNSPHGKNKAGIISLSKFDILSAKRRSLPIEESLMKFVDLDRCYSVSRIKMENGKELVLYNVHLSAYTSDGKIAEEQLRMLIEDMQEEYNKGNYIVCGGDFNKDLSGNAEEYFGISGGEYTWAQPIPKDMFNNSNLRLVFAYDENTMVPSCRNADDVYNLEQFVLTVDGFIISDNVEIISSRVIDLKFEYSDHNPVEMIFKLK